MSYLWEGSRVQPTKHSPPNPSPTNTPIPNGDSMVYLLQLLPTYILHFTYGISLGKLHPLS